MHMQEVSPEAAALAAMTEKAQEMQIRGAAVVMIGSSDSKLFVPQFTQIGTFYRSPRPDINDPGTNYLAIALNTLAEMVVSHFDSGTIVHRPMEGEFGKMGGKYQLVGSKRLLVAFSGSGYLSQRLKIAQAGMAKLLELVSE